MFVKQNLTFVIFQLLYFNFAVTSCKKNSFVVICFKGFYYYRLMAWRKKGSKILNSWI